MPTVSPSLRNVVFISKATPGDDEFALWLAPRLEASGYTVYADIIRLEPGVRWRQELTNTLQARAVKMLLCGRDSTLSRNGVQEEIGIAEDLARELKDPKFIIPLRLERYKKVFGIGELQFIDFSNGWASGLNQLLNALDKEKVPRDSSAIRISPNWEQYRQRNGVLIKNEPEPLTSNWLRVVEIPDTIRYFSPKGAIDHAAFSKACGKFRFHGQVHERGFFSFASLDDVNAELAHIASFEITHECDTLTFVRDGYPQKNIEARESSNFVKSIFRKAWEAWAINAGLLRIEYSKDAAFHVTKDQARIGQRIPWGTQGEKHSSMLRNIARKHVWSFGVTAIPSFWPYYHFKMKSRVLFSEVSGTEAGPVLQKKGAQHRLRRSVCKGWRNKQWHGRLRAFLELLVADSAYVTLSVGSQAGIKLEAVPIFFTSPVTTDLPDIADDAAEEADETTMTGPIPDDDEDDANEA
ncbi:toll/interleukin-1 receptor domain-containing protein [Bradyrhizobium sp. DASA03068]|uniref:toll/interleukin-1 receptor domain-containing protein n=1 Tax=Bradyrhizobium sp. BLXBL-01 TaxID=3395915 RepID=UPI003F6F1AE9